jgi:hypothetical protein
MRHRHQWLNILEGVVVILTRSNVDIEHFFSTAKGAEDELPLKHEEDVIVVVPLLSSEVVT